MITVSCPHCEKPVAWSAESLYRPFCSERCRMIDLGAWADNAYAIPIKGSTSDPDEDENTLENNFPEE